MRPETKHRVLLGLERLASSTLLTGRRVGLVCNPASVDGAFRHAVDCVASLPGVALGALFGPQHGFHADVQDNMVETSHAHDLRRRVPVYSLYSEIREPTADMLRGLDVLVIDLPDVGTRVYTFAHTMANCLRAAKTNRLPVIVCDRPNPVGGDQIEGPVLAPGFESFVGQFPVPLRHGLTMGELARVFNDHFGIGADLTVVAMQGWQRPMYQDDTVLPWIMPSPNMPTLETAVVYPGTVLFEGTNLSEGRGTTRPFEVVGAPWVDGHTLARRVNARQLPGVYFRPLVFQPTFQKHTGQTCGGCQIHVVDRARFEPVVTAVTLLHELFRTWPEQCAWRQPPYEYEDIKLPIDILAGSDSLRHHVDAGTDPEEVAEEWASGVAEFRLLRERFLLY